MKHEFKVPMLVEITNEDIDDIVCTALEGGINYWCSKVEVDGEYLGEYASEQISRGGKLKVFLDEPFDENDTEEYELTNEKLLKGIKMYSESLDRPYEIVVHEKNKFVLDCCQVDAEVADMIIQLALFEDIIYG